VPSCNFAAFSSEARQKLIANDIAGNFAWFANMWNGMTGMLSSDELTSGAKIDGRTPVS